MKVVNFSPDNDEFIKSSLEIFDDMRRQIESGEVTSWCAVALQKKEYDPMMWQYSDYKDRVALLGASLLLMEHLKDVL